MSVKIDATRRVSNWNLSEWLFDILPPGTYYLTLATQWNGSEAEKPQIVLVREMEDGYLSGMSIGDPTDIRGLRSYAETNMFQATNENCTVFVRRK